MDNNFIQSRITQLVQEDLINKLYGKERTHFVEKLELLNAISSDPTLNNGAAKLNQELCDLIGIDPESLRKSFE